MRGQRTGALELPRAACHAQRKQIPRLSARLPQRATPHPHPAHQCCAGAQAVVLLQHKQALYLAHVLERHPCHLVPRPQGGGVPHQPPQCHRADDRLAAAAAAAAICCCERQQHAPAGAGGVAARQAGRTGPRPATPAWWGGGRGGVQERRRRRAAQGGSAAELPKLVGGPLGATLPQCTGGWAGLCIARRPSGRERTRYFLVTSLNCARCSSFVTGRTVTGRGPGCAAIAAAAGRQAPLQCAWGLWTRVRGPIER